MNWYKKSQTSPILQWIETMILSTKNSGRKLPGTKYSHPDEFFREHGKFFESQELTEEEAKTVEQAVGNGRDFKKKQCFYNSQVIAQQSELKYVEGFCYTGMFPMAHAWNSINGKVVDVTLYHRNGGLPILGTFPEGWEYFGVDFPVREIFKVWMEHKSSLPIISYETDFDYLKRNHPEEQTENTQKEDLT